MMLLPLPLGRFFSFFSRLLLLRERLFVFSVRLLIVRERLLLGRFVAMALLVVGWVRLLLGRFLSFFSVLQQCAHSDDVEEKGELGFRPCERNVVPTHQTTAGYS
jgi:hypothetical protein